MIVLLASLGLIYLLVSMQEWRDAVGGAATALVRPILVPLVNIILEPSFVYTTAVGLFFAAAAACAAFWYKVARPQRDRLRILRSEVTRLRRPTSQIAAEKFEALQKLGDLFRHEGMFLSAWALFQTHLVQTQRISEQPFGYFAAEEPPDGAIDHRGFMAALPGYFTSVGLILTFIGLVVALYFAAKGFRSGNLDQARESILQLLNASAFKFITSVAALGSALFVSVFYRFCLSMLRAERLRTIAVVEAYISIWRDIEIAASGRFGRPDNEISGKLDILTETILELTVELRGLSLKLADTIQSGHPA